MADIKQRIDLDLSGTISGLERTAALVGEVNQQTSNLQKTYKTAFTGAADVVENYNKSLGDGVKVYNKIEQAAKEAGKAQADALKGATGQTGDLKKSIQQLEIALTSYQNIVKESTDTKVIAEYNAKIAQTRKELERIGNVGKKGFDMMGKPIKAQMGMLERLQKQAELYRKGITTATNPDNIAKYNRKLQETEARIKQLTNQGKKGFDEMGREINKNESLLSKMGKAAAGFFAVGMLVNWAKQAGQAILNVTAEFQKFEAVLTTSLGSGSAAERAMLMIQDFAARTPFSVQELTDAYVKLAGRGIRATSKEMEALGDLAASTGKSFDQLTEAVLDAMSGENERLKEFGILAKKTGETTQYTFKGVTTEVKNSDQAIKEYLISLGSVEGVTGSMAAISETLTGRISNLGDAIDGLWLTIGEQETGVMASFISFLSSAVEEMTLLIATTDQLAKKMSSAAIAEFATKTEADFKTAAQAAKAAGQDIQAELARQSSVLTAQLEHDLKKAEAQLKKFEETASKASLLLNPKQYGIDKGAEAAVKATVTKIQGQLAAIKDAERLVLGDMQKVEDAAAQQRLQAQAEAAKKAAEARKKAFADLQKMLLSLENDAERARINLLDKNSRLYLEKQRDYDLQQIQNLEKQIREKQRLAGLDPTLSVEQMEQLRILAAEVTKKYYDALTKLENSERDKLLELQKDSDAKELQQLENKYNDQIRAAEEAGQREVAIALRTAKEVEKAKLQRSQKERTLDNEEALFTAFAETSLPDDMPQVERERLLQERILEIQIEYAEKRLALVADSLDIEDRIKAQQLTAEIQRFKAKQQELKDNTKKFSLQKLLGLDDEQMAAVKEATSYALGQLQEFLANTVALRQKEVESLTRAIDEKGNELDREIALNAQGFASNVETKRQEYEELKRQRKEAADEQRKAQRQQIMLDSALQISNMITSSSNIFKVLSPIPFVGVPLAIGLIASMFGAFIAAKSKAMQAASAPQFAKGGEGTLIKGASHSQGGIDVVENRTGRKIANIEGGENFYVTNRKSTDKYWPFLQAINANDETALSKLSLNWLLDGTGVTPAKELPAKMQKVHTATKTAHTQAASERHFKEMNQHLQAIAGNTKPAKTVTETADFIIQQAGYNTRIIRKHV